MQSSFYLRIVAGAVLAAGMAGAAVVDRVAVVIGKKVITQSEVEQDLRLTEFINAQPLDLGPLALRDAAQHLIDQELIRQEMQNGAYAQTSASQADALLRKFRQEHYPSDAAYHAALQKYGVTEAELKQRLVWQLAAIQFTDFRFRPLQAPEGAQSADRAADGTSSSVDQQMEAWLKQARSDTKIVLKPEAFR